MKLKVCGMRDADNIAEVAALNPDFMGFIFFEKSPRNVIGKLAPETLNVIPETIKKIGVFVNENEATILRQVADYQLDGVQLHGAESPELCEALLQRELLVFKAFSVNETFDFSQVNPYKHKVTYFLFDTKATGGYGGHGVAFDWKLLDNYDNEVPFLLAGGVGLDNIAEVKELATHLNLAGIDVNSRFETAPAMKDISKLKTLVREIR